MKYPKLATIDPDKLRAEVARLLDTALDGAPEGWTFHQPSIARPRVGEEYTVKETSAAESCLRYLQQIHRERAARCVDAQFKMGPDEAPNLLLLKPTSKELTWMLLAVRETVVGLLRPLAEQAGTWDEPEEELAVATPPESRSVQRRKAAQRAARATPKG